jgi:hypothetical protein
MPDSSIIGDNAVYRDAVTRNRNYKYLSVDFASRRITNEFAFADVSYTFQRNRAGEFSATMDLYDPAAAFLKPQETFIVVERMGLPFWCGFLWQPTRSGKTLNINAQEVWSLFGHRHVRVSQKFNNTDRAAIFRNLVLYGQQGVGGDLGVSVGSELLGGTPMSEFIVNWWENKTIVEVAQPILDQDPSFTFRIVGEWLPGNRLGFRMLIDTKHPVPTTHRLIYGGNVDEYDWAPFSPSPNFIDGFGGFDNEAMIRRSVQNDGALLRQPRIEGSTENRDLLGEEGVVKLATDALKRLSGSPSQPTVTMLADSDPVLGLLRPGHSAHVSIRDGYVYVDGDFNVDKIAVSVPNGAADAPGAESVQIEFESKLEADSVTMT